MDPRFRMPVPATAAAAPDAKTLAAAAKERAAIRKAASGIEEALFKQMLESMTHAQLESGSFFGTGSAAGTRETTFEMLLSQRLAEGSPLGVADQLTDRMMSHRGLAAVAEAGAHADTAALAATAASTATAATAGSAGMAAIRPGGTATHVFNKFTATPQVRPPGADEEGGDSRFGRDR
jgi:Rod binding domain-containing protein